MSLTPQVIDLDPPPDYIVRAIDRGQCLDFPVHRKILSQASDRIAQTVGNGMKEDHDQVWKINAPHHIMARLIAHIYDKSCYPERLTSTMLDPSCRHLARTDPWQKVEQGDPETRADLARELLAHADYLHLDDLCAMTGSAFGAAWYDRQEPDVKDSMADKIGSEFLFEFIAKVFAVKRDIRSAQSPESSKIKQIVLNTIQKNREWASLDRWFPELCSVLVERKWIRPDQLDAPSSINTKDITVYVTIASECRRSSPYREFQVAQSDRVRDVVSKIRHTFDVAWDTQIILKHKSRTVAVRDSYATLGLYNGALIIASLQRPPRRTG